MNGEHDCPVLLLGGMSGTGKSTAAAEIGRRSGIPWLQVDDLRLAFQRSRITLPERTDALYYFTDVETRPNIWRQPPELLRDALIAVGYTMSPAIEAVIDNHVDQCEPLIIEGDGIVPALFDRPAVRKRFVRHQVRAVFLVESDEEVLFTNMLARARGITHMTESDLRAEARAKWLFGYWIAEQATDRGLPVVAPRPWNTLIDRILDAG